MTTCCYCAETNNSLVLLEEAATVECKICKLKMHTKCYIVAHTSRTLVCNPADAEAVRCATHDTALTAHDQKKPVPKKAPTKKQSVPVATTTPVEFDRRRFAVIDGNNRIAAITNILKLP